MSQAKGDRRERELVNALDEAGFAVMRAPASGAATDRELPDVGETADDVFDGAREDIDSANNQDIIDTADDTALESPKGSPTLTGRRVELDVISGSIADYGHPHTTQVGDHELDFV